MVFCSKYTIFAAIMTQEEKTMIEERIVDVLKTVYDPEIPVNIYDLGMIYKIDVQDDYSVELEMTSNVNLVFEPAWDQSMMSEEARVELGFD